LHDLIWWAGWRIDRPLTREQIRYQRWRVVTIFIRRYKAEHHGKERSSRKYAFDLAAQELTGPFAGSPRTMKEDFLALERLPNPDSVRSKKLEQRASEANRKRARRRKR
jgi:hypothetical protein